VSACGARRSAPALGLAFAGYVAALVWLTWPLGAHLGTHVANTILPCRTDIPYIAWTLAWQSHALTTHPLAYADANIYWPASRALLYGDPGLAALPLFAPVFLATGNPALAVNVLFLGGLALTALCLHAVLYRWTGSHAAGVVAAAVFLLDPWGIWRFFSWAPSYTVLGFVPIIAYLTSRPLSWRRVAVLALLVALQAAANFVYLAAMVFPPLVVLAAARLARRATRDDGLRLAVALGGALALLAPVYAAYLAVRAESPQLPEQSTWAANTTSPALEGLPLAMIGGIPRIATRVPTDLVWRSAPTYLTVTAIVVIAAGLLLRRRRAGAASVPAAAWRQAWLWTLMGFAMATPAVEVFGGVPFRLPYVIALERLVPFVPQVIRDFSRLGIAAMLGLALLAGLAFAEIVAARAPRRAALLTAVVVAGLAIEYRLQKTPPFAVMAMPDASSPVAAALRAGQGPVLELPVGWAGTQPWPHARAMYRSIFHWRPLVNGYSSYWPAGFAERMALALRLPDAGALAELRRETGVTSIVVDGDYLDARAFSDWRGLADAGGGKGLGFVMRSGNVMLFRVEGDSP
jgi:hypothetical protein